MARKKTTVLVLFGGSSSEHEVSRRSACFVLKNLSPEKYQVYTVGITKDGRWILTGASLEEIADGRWENHASNRPFFPLTVGTEAWFWLVKPALWKF